MTIQDLIDAICEALYTEFGASYEIYTEKVEQNLTPPCFLVRCLNPTKNVDLSRRYKRTNPFSVQYIPSTAEAQGEMLSVLEKLFECLKNITVSSKTVHGLELSGQIVDEAITFTVNYDVFELESYTGTAMATLEMDVDGRTIPIPTSAALFFAQPFVGTYSYPPELNYTALQYLESSGSEYIKTEYYFGENSGIELKAMTTDISTRDVWQQLCGARQSYHSAASIQVGYNLSIQYLSLEIGTGLAGGTAMAKNTDFIVKMTATSATIDGVAQTLEGTFTGTSPYPLWIFDENDAGSSERRYKGRIYYFKIYENGVLVRNLQPYLRKNDDEPGFLDTVSGTFYTNQGGGAFSYALAEA